MKAGVENDRFLVHFDTTCKFLFPTGGENGIAVAEGSKQNAESGHPRKFGEKHPRNLSLEASLVNAVSS